MEKENIAITRWVRGSLAWALSHSDPITALYFSEVFCSNFFFNSCFLYTHNPLKVKCHRTLGESFNLGKM